MPNHLEQAIFAFEHGDYQQVIALLLVAKTHSSDAQIHAQIQLWLANAYGAIGEFEQAIAICEQLKSNPDRQVRKHAAFVAEILAAPNLSKPANLNLEIPLLSDQAYQENRRRLKFKSIQAIAPSPTVRLDELDWQPPIPNVFGLADRLALIGAIGSASLILVWIALA